jgi:hypothetical protein
VCYNRISVISSRLRHRRVFLLVDDVDAEEQIEEALAWSPDLFGEGTRIILISRDFHKIYFDLFFKCLK